MNRCSPSRYAAAATREMGYCRSTRTTVKAPTSIALQQCRTARIACAAAGAFVASLNKYKHAVSGVQFSPGSGFDHVSDALIAGQLLIRSAKGVHRHYIVVCSMKADGCALCGFPAADALRVSSCKLALQLQLGCGLFAGYLFKLRLLEVKQLCRLQSHIGSRSAQLSAGLLTQFWSGPCSCCVSLSLPA